MDNAAFANIIFLGFLLAIFYFLLIRPQRRRVQQHRDLVASVSVGDEIVTIGGIHGTVRSMGDEDIEIEVSPGTNIRLVKSAIARKVAAEEPRQEFGTTGGDAP